MSAEIAIREMTAGDCPIIAAAFAAQGWDKPLAQYQRYYQESLDGRRLVLVAETAGQFAGYLTVLWESHYPPFREVSIPEIVDFNVLIKFRRRKIGTALLDAAEQRIALRSAIAGLGVGLYIGYGPAQALYVRRGYVPDGRGVYYHGEWLDYGKQLKIDDDLCLYLTRQVR